MTKTTKPARFAEYPTTTEGGNCVADVTIELRPTGPCRTEARFLLRLDGRVIRYSRTTQPWSMRPNARTLKMAPKWVTPENFAEYAQTLADEFDAERATWNSWQRA